jgi:hypothetical protein
MRALPLFAGCFAILLAGSMTRASAQSPPEETEAERVRRIYIELPRQRFERISEIARTCEYYAGIVDVPPGPLTDYRQDNRSLLRRMLEQPGPGCPDLPTATMAFIRAEIGEPERADVDLDLLGIGWRAAERGLGMAPDPALADRYGRMLWLFDSPPPDLPRWPEAERQAWLMRPETVALLQARVSDSELRTYRASELLTGLLLSPDAPGYDPQEALTLIEGSGDSLEISRLLSEGAHLPRDHGRAARILIDRAYPDISALARRGELLRIGRLAAAAARTPVEQAEALRILSAATLREYFNDRDRVNALLRRIGQAPEAVLAPADAELVARTMDSWDQLPRWPAGLRPIVLRALIGPDGRIVTTEVAQSSGAASQDHMVRALWVKSGAGLDLGATAQGRFVWATFPPIQRSR